MINEIVVESKFQLGFSSLNSEVSLESLPVEGRIPVWLGGSLFRNGPARFEIGATSYSHWFDGLAMLHRYSFHNGQVSYRNRFLQTETFKRTLRTGKVTSEFGTVGKELAFLRWLRLGKMLVGGGGKGGYNTNVSIAQFGKYLVALTEPPHPTLFDPNTLVALGVFDFKDKIGGQVSTPHPHYDYENKQIINYVTQFGRKCSYNVYRMPNGKTSRSIIGTIPVRQPAYMHSFATTKNYIILTEFPFVVNPLEVITSGKPYIENFKWKPQDGTNFIVMHKQSGEIAGIFQSEAFFAFHHINAFEKHGDIFIDLCAMPTAEAVYGGYLDKVRTAVGKADSNRQMLRRYRIPLSKGAIKNPDISSYEVMCSESIDLPGINYQENAARDYRYTYGVSSNQAWLEAPANQLIKVDLERRTVKKWFVAGCYPGETIFVPNPYPRAEDDGVVLSVVLDGNIGKSFLLVLDGESFEELGRAMLPHHVPLEFHGYYAPDISYRP